MRWRETWAGCLWVICIGATGLLQGCGREQTSPASSEQHAQAGTGPAQEDTAPQGAGHADAAADASLDAGPPDAGPPKRIFAKRFVVSVRTAPDRASESLGYLRAGSVVQATGSEPIGHEGCRGGWYELTTGGHVCAGRDVIPFLGRRLPARRSAQPDLQAPLPYDYARNRRDRTPMYRRLPTDEEASQYEGFRIPGEEVENQGSPEAQPGGAPTQPGAASTQPGAASTQPGEENSPQNTANSPSQASATPSQVGSRTPRVAAAGSPISPQRVPLLEGNAERSAHGTSPRAAAAPAAQSAGQGQASPGQGPQGQQETQGQEEGGEEEELVPTLDSLQGERGSVVQRRLVPGFIVSLDRDFRAGRYRRRYWRTLSNGYLPYRTLVPVRGSAFHGMEITEEVTLPVGYVMSRRVRQYVRRGERLSRGRPAGYHFGFSVRGTETYRNTDYLVASETLWLRQQDVRQIELREPPEGVAEGAKWIDVNLSRQTVVAYEGTRPVYATLMSSGRVRNPDDPLQNHATPTGLFRVRSKHLTHTMDGDHAADGPYSIEDVPYVMYFQLAYALHSAFWHNAFGRPKSHGCVNLAPQDARWLFQWADPPLPEGWHAIYARDHLPNTWVHVHGETPQG